MMQRRDGTQFPAYIMNAPIQDAEGNLIGIVGVSFDISERKQLESELHERSEELQQWATDLEERVDARTSELERSNRELQEFAYVASHDLQEPLRKIIAFADRLRSRFGASMEPDALDYMERMQNAAERMKVLINDLLTLSRVTTRGQPFVDVNLRQIAENVLEDMITAIEAAHGRVDVADLPTLEADPSQMSRLLLNLISNSLKFRNEQEAPAISIWSETDYDSEYEKPLVRLFVKDNGVGFDEKYLDRIFQPFQRLHGRMDYAGTGMGLAICRRIVERHQGEITARSAPNTGATFIITLPAQQSGKVTSIQEE